MDNRKVGIILALLMIIFGIVILANSASAAITQDDANHEIDINNEADCDMEAIDAVVDATVLFEESADVYLCNYTINLIGNSQLSIDGTRDCTWLKLNASNLTGDDEASIKVHEQASLFVNDTMITAWNVTGNCNATNGTGDFRPYIYIYSDGTEATQPYAHFLNSTMGYLGWNIDTKYGIYYGITTPGYWPSGYVHNCTIMENWIGVDFVSVPNMNVTNTWINHTYEAGIVYTGSSHNGYIGDHPSLTHRVAYDSTSADYFHADKDLTHMGIRINQADNMTLSKVNVQDAYTEGIYVVQGCVNHSWDNVTVYGCTNAADDYQIYLSNVDESNFTDCTAIMPNGDVDGGNWQICGDNICSYNNFTRLIAYGSTAHEDVYLQNASYCWFYNCTVNNSAEGFDLEQIHNITFHDCNLDGHTNRGFNIYASREISINRGFVNTTAEGIKVYDADGVISQYNTITDTTLNDCTSYGIYFGVEGGGVTDACTKNNVSGVTIDGTTTGDGIYFFDSCHNNSVYNVGVTNCAHANANGIGLHNDVCYNEIIDGAITDCGNACIAIEDNAHHNWINTTICDNTAADFGLSLSGDGAHNNSLTGCTFDSSGWGAWIWPGAGNTNQDNNFTSCTFDSNAQTGIDIGRAGTNYFYQCTVHDNTCDNVEVSTGGKAYFYETVAYGCGSSYYDFDLTAGTEVDIYNDYCFTGGTNAIGDSSPYNYYDHDTGDTAKTLTTKDLIGWMSDGHSGAITISTWTTTPQYRLWTVTAANGAFYARAGGFGAALYQVKCSGVNLHTYTSAVGTDPTGTATRDVVVTYGGGWSTKNFEITSYTSGGGGGGSSGGSSGSDDDDSTSGSSSPSGDGITSSVLGVPLYLWILLLIVIIILLVLFWDNIYAVFTGKKKKGKKKK